MCGPTSSRSTKKRVAIIGSDINALLVGWYLYKNDNFDITIFSDVEENNRPQNENNLNLDVCLFNDQLSPTLSAVLDELEVSYSGKICRDRFLSHSFELRGSRASVLLSWSSVSDSSENFKGCSFRNEIDGFLSYLTSILKYEQDDPQRAVSVSELVQARGFSNELITGFLLPILGGDKNCLYSTTANELVRFLWEIGLLQGKVVEDTPGQYNIVNVGLLESKLRTLLHDNINASVTIESIEKVADKMEGTNKTSYEVVSSSQTSLGMFEDILFSSSSPLKVASFCKSLAVDEDLSTFLSNMKEKTKITKVYYHKDKGMKASASEATFNWLSNMDENGNNSNVIDPRMKKKCEAMEGGESGFGKQAADKYDMQHGSFLTFNVKDIIGDDLLLSLNPTTPPNPDMVCAYKTFTHSGGCRNFPLQGKEGLWFNFRGNDIIERDIDFFFRYERICADAKFLAHNILEQNLPTDTFESQIPIAQEYPSLAIPSRAGFVSKLYRTLTYTLPVELCKRMIIAFLRGAIKKGVLQLKLNDGSIIVIGTPTNEEGVDRCPVVIRVFEDWFFVKTALEYDLGMARSYMAGHFIVEALPSPSDYDPTLLWPEKNAHETTSVLGDPIGLTRLFLLFIANRDSVSSTTPFASANAHNVKNALSNASGLVIAKIGGMFNFIRYKMTMDNSEKGGSLKNIHAHYDLSNDLFRTFLDPETLMYSSAIFDGVTNPNTRELMYKGSLEEAQWRKLDTLLERAQMTNNNLAVLDIGFGWGGLSIHAARKFNARVHGITLSVEQMALASERVKEEGLEHLITFEVVDYRTFSKKKKNQGRFDRVLSCEMIEAVGHEHLGEFYESVDRVLKRNGILVMEAITTPEERYETYIRTTDFINTIIFPGSCCPSLHALVDAAYNNSTLTLEHVSNIGVHYARTLAEWRRRFNRNEITIRQIGFDSVFLRVWNYYLTYCEAAFYSRTENCLILVFARPGCNALAPLAESREVCQADLLTPEEANDWLTE